MHANTYLLRFHCYFLRFYFLTPQFIRNFASEIRSKNSRRFRKTHHPTRTTTEYSAKNTPTHLSPNPTMIIKDHETCPQLAENTARFEATISPMLQQLKGYALCLPHDTQHFDEDWQDALIDLWQQLHECPSGEERQWAQWRIWCRLSSNHANRCHKASTSKCCETEEDELCSSEESATKMCFSSELDQLENNVSCVRTAKIVQKLRQQPQLDRAIVLMRLDDFTFSEIADALKLTKSAVIYRFRQTILVLKAAAR